MEKQPYHSAVYISRDLCLDHDWDWRWAGSYLKYHKAHAYGWNFNKIERHTCTCSAVSFEQDHKRTKK